MGLLGPLLVQVVAWGAAALQAGPHRDPAVATGLLDLGNMGFFLLPFPAALLTAATSLAAPPGVLLPAWLARAGLPAAALMAVGGFVLAAALAFVLFGLWLAAAALALMRRPPPSALPAEGSTAVVRRPADG